MYTILLVCTSYMDGSDLKKHFQEIMSVCEGHLQHSSICMINKQNILNKLTGEHTLNATCLHDDILKYYNIDIEVTEAIIPFIDYIKQCANNSVKLILFIGCNILNELFSKNRDNMYYIMPIITEDCKILFYDFIDVNTNKYGFTSIEQIRTNHILSALRARVHHYDGVFREYKDKMREFVRKISIECVENEFNSKKYDDEINSILRIIRTPCANEIRLFKDTYTTVTTVIELSDLIIAYEDIFDTAIKSFLKSTYESTYGIENTFTVLFNKMFDVCNENGIMHYTVKVHYEDEPVNQFGGLINNTYDSKIMYYTNKLNKYKYKKYTSMINKY
jgi:hypothetical protein